MNFRLVDKNSITIRYPIKLFIKHVRNINLLTGYLYVIFKIFLATYSL